MHRLQNSRIDRAVSLPAVGTLLNEPAYAELVGEYGRPRVVEAIREQIASERSGETDGSQRHAAVASRLRAAVAPNLRWVINATGVILHTNLGRAPLSRAAMDALAVAAGYSNLELDLVKGRRGERAALVGGLLTSLFKCEAALVVNNNAAAVLLTLTALCRGKEVMVSRGQLVEIGGSFRMPDVMRMSGARMVEVGTTNRTRASDYEEAVTSRTAALLRVHTSNYRVSGFTEAVSLTDMEAISRRHDLLLIDDLGSGAAEPVVVEAGRARRQDDPDHGGVGCRRGLSARPRAPNHAQRLGRAGLPARHCAASRRPAPDLAHRERRLLHRSPHCAARRG